MMRLSSSTLNRLARFYSKLPFQKWVVYVITYEAVPSEQPDKAPPAGVRFGEATLADLDALATAVGDRGKRELFEQRFRAGRRCFAAFAENAVIAYVWVSPTIDPDLEDAPPLKLAKDEAYISDAFVVPEWRRKNLHYFTGRMAGQAVADAGCRNAISLIKAFNIASLKASAAWGRPVAVLEQRVFLKWQHWRARPFTGREMEAIKSMAPARSPAASGRIELDWMEKRGNARLVFAR
jgi:hypothetical protein